MNQVEQKQALKSQVQRIKIYTEHITMMGKREEVECVHDDMRGLPTQVQNQVAAYYSHGQF